MRAAVLTAFRQPLEVWDLPDPEPGVNDALIRVEACGVCRSDWHVWQGDWNWVGIQVELPRVLGHEFGGVIEEVGSGVKRFKRGDRVTIPFHLACGACEYCWTGRSNLCLAFRVMGVHHDGGYGSLSKVPNADATLVRVPDSIDAVTTAAIGCRFMTAYHAIIDQAKVSAGEWVAIFGMGGVGLSAVQIAASAGAHVIAVSNSPERLERAKQEGAAAAIRAGSGAHEEILQVTDGGAHVTVDALGATETAAVASILLSRQDVGGAAVLADEFVPALSDVRESGAIVSALLSLRRGGRHVQPGLTGAKEAGILPVPVDLMVLKELKLVGSLGCPTTSYTALLSLIAAGKLTPKRLVERTIAVDEATHVLADMTEYRTRGFSVINDWSETARPTAQATA